MTVNSCLLSGNIIISHVLNLVSCPFNIYIIFCVQCGMTSELKILQFILLSLPASQSNGFQPSENIFLLAWIGLACQGTHAFWHLNLFLLQLIWGNMAEDTFSSWALPYRPFLPQPPSKFKCFDITLFFIWHLSVFFPTFIVVFLRHV